MITTIIAWLYITLLCYAWGNMLLHFVAKQLKWKNGVPIHFSLICLTGLVIIGGIVQILSLFIPIQGWLIHIPFIIPCFFISYSGIQYSKVKAGLRWIYHIPRLLLTLLLLCILLILTMSTWTISHPDTITYHIEIIKWIEQSKALPGIANLNERLGLQSTWFPACAFFSFTHAGAAYYVHLNAIVIVWVVLFIVTQINKCHIEKSPAAILWILLLSIHLWSYSQIRLTVTSTSPDFIAAIYIMFSIYFLYRQEKTQSEIIPVIIILFSFFSVCLKLSSTPVLIATIYLIIRLILWRKHKALFISLLISCILLSGFLFRNAISSGYVLFPSTFPNIVNKDWKLNEEVCKHVSAYIAAFAKTESHQSDEAINLANNMKIHEWMPVWWSLRSLADKIIIALSVLSLLAIVLQIKKIKQLSITNIVCILTPIVGSLFWFYLAPDPRFGFGFLLSLIGIAVHISSSKKKFILYSGRFLFSLLIILNISIGAYIVYRFNNYFSTRQIIYPIGVEAIPAQS